MKNSDYVRKICVDPKPGPLINCGNVNLNLIVSKVGIIATCKY